MTALPRSPGRPGLPRAGRPRLSRALSLALGLACLVAAAACNVPGARIHNLQELHGDSARHVRDARLLSGLEYYIRYGAADLFGQRLSQGQDRKDRSVSDPLAACLRNVNALARIESEDERVSAAQVSEFCWLAVDDPWKLTREACVRALGAHGRRLGIEVPAAPGGPLAGPEEVRAALAALVRALRLSGPLAWPETQSSEPEPEPETQSSAPGAGSEGVAGACAAIEALELDRAGALRLLRGVGALELALSRSDPRAERMRGTLRRIEAACVAETLLLALKDEAPAGAGGSHPGWGSPLVRAAAVTACVEAFGDSALGELLSQLHLERSDQVVRAVLAAVARRGLPEPSEQVPEERRELLLEHWIDLILQEAFDNPSGSARVAAMRALRRISGGELASLREEDWLEWDRARPRTPGSAPAGPEGPARP